MGIKSNIRSSLGRDVVEISEHYGLHTVWVKPSFLTRACTLLASVETLGFDILMDSFAVEVTGSSPIVFEVYYNLLNQRSGDRVFVATNIEENEVIPSLTIIFSNVDWYEREMFDMFGIKFSGRPCTGRILTHNCSVHPMRK